MFNGYINAFLKNKFSIYAGFRSLNPTHVGMYLLAKLWHLLPFLLNPTHVGMYRGTPASESYAGLLNPTHVGMYRK